MAFVPNYTHDVFVSYAHRDDQPMPSFTKGWVKVLVEALRTKLNQALGSDADIFIDDALSRHEGVTVQLDRKLRESATLLVILSPGYLESAWCRRESGTFLAEDLKGRVAAGARVFLVDRGGVERTARPREFIDFTGFAFWVPDDAGRPRILCQDGDLQGSLDTERSKYYERLDLLTFELAGQLKDLRAHPGGTRPRSSGPPPSGPHAGNGQAVVWLAEVTDDLEDRREQIRGRLAQLGVRVLPDPQYEQGAETLADVMTREIRHCKLFVQLLSSVSGRRMPRVGQTRGRYQYEAAKTAGISLLQWRDPDLDVRTVMDRDQRALLESARAEGFEDFNRAIRDRVLAAPPKPPVVRPRALVFVDSGVEDQDIADVIGREIKEDVDVSFSVWTPDLKPSEVRSQLKEKMRGCQALIIVYGGSPPEWVREHIIESRNILYGPGKELQALAVYVGPPPKPVPVQGQFMVELDGRTGWGDEQRQQLKAFVRKISFTPAT